MAQLRIGTCSWKYDSWKGIIYPAEKDINYLEEYSKHFNTVEVDQWFWSLHAKNKIILPKPADVNSYKDSVDKDFKFSIKIPNSITLTHLYRKEKSEDLIPNQHFLSKELLKQFLKSINPLKKNLGPLMLQFEYLNKQKMKSQFDFHLLLDEFTKKLPQNILFALEIRNPNYLNKNYFEFLSKRNLGHVFLQGYYMPPIYEIYNQFKNNLKNFVVIRLHGPDRKGIEEKTGSKWDQIIDPKDEELEKIISMIQELLEKKIDVYVNVNNHYEGSAPLTIQKIKKILS